MMVILSDFKSVAFLCSLRDSKTNIFKNNLSGMNMCQFLWASHYYSVDGGLKLIRISILNFFYN